MHVQGVLETAICAVDLEQIEAFYGDVVGLPLVDKEPGRHLFFRCGQGMLLIFDAAATRSQTVRVAGAVIPQHGTEGEGHVCFRVVEGEFEAWRERLTSAGYAIESEIAWPNGGRSLYTRDASGNSVEFATGRLWGFVEQDGK